MAKARYFLNISHVLIFSISNKDGSSISIGLFNSASGNYLPLLLFCDKLWQKPPCRDSSIIIFYLWVIIVLALSLFIYLDSSLLYDHLSPRNHRHCFFCQFITSESSSSLFCDSVSLGATSYLDKRKEMTCMSTNPTMKQYFPIHVVS